jgi:cbb3-type cytochrome oxidase cytochrome c subunit
MERKTALGVAIVVLGVVVIAAVAVLAPTATCESTSGEISGLSPIEFINVSDGSVVYSRDGGASICSIDVVVLGVPAGLVVASVGLFVLGS